MTPAQAKRIVLEALRQRNLPFAKLTAKTINFTDLARGSCIFVRIHDLSWDEDGSTREGLENGSLIAFCARARVFLRGMEIASDYLDGCVYKSLDDFQDHKECAAYTRKLWRQEGKFNIYRGPMRNGAVSNKDKLKARGFMTRERAEKWAQENAKEEYHITESAGCGSYFADMVRSVCREARKSVDELNQVHVRTKETKNQ